MDGVDLNIENYALSDILKLYNLDYSFTYEDLRMSMKRLYQIHPDKSGLDSKYFIFYKEAYSILLAVYRHRSKSTNFRENFDSNESKVKLKKLLEHKNFNMLFNKLFEESFTNKNVGHGDWLKSDSSLSEAETNMTKEEYFKKMHSSVACNNNINISASIDNTHNLIDDSETFESFSNKNLVYDDVKKVYSEKYIPINVNNNRINKYKNIEEIQRDRGSRIEELSNEESHRILNTEKERDQELSSHKMYKIIQQDKNYEKQSKKWWLGFNKICYNTI
jgi:hypothetical protein